ncbi:substrate-binding periplasmic protein [Algicola sagamiensis]|uniref:substrate-binding periplasmic protein n=1 Tax=Algicola sagamiensis TaxID=163869 RepID=UPI00037FBA6B|nr:transporter substrate-binding domain-containing protein [Algicola sagamiensis]
MKYIIQIALILCTLFSQNLAAKKLIAAGDPWPPFIDPKAENGGIALEIVRAAFQQKGHEIEMKIVPWARALEGVKEGNYDILVATWYTEERDKFLEYSEHYLSNQIKFIKKKGDSFCYKDIPSLDGKIIGTVRGYGYGDKFLQAKNFKRSETVTLVQNIRKLISGRVDLTLEDEVVAKALIKAEDPSALEKIEFCPTPLSKNDLHVTSGYKNKLYKTIITSFNEGLKEIKSNGTFDKVMKKYGL